MKSRLDRPVSAPAWGASSAERSSSGSALSCAACMEVIAGSAPVEAPASGPPGGPGLRARRSLVYDLLGGGALLLAWMLLWSWFAVAMVQPARPRGPAAGAAVQGFSQAARRHMVPPDTSRIFRTEATPQRAPQAAHTS